MTTAQETTTSPADTETTGFSGDAVQRRPSYAAAQPDITADQAELAIGFIREAARGFGWGDGMSALNALFGSPEPRITIGALECELRRCARTVTSLRDADEIFWAHRHLHHLLTVKPFERMQFVVTFIDSVSMGSPLPDWCRESVIARSHELRARLVALIRDLIKWRSRVSINSEVG